MSASIYISQNGNLIIDSAFQISPNNRSFRYGDGCFETMKVIKGQLLLGDYHFDRLFNSLKLLQFELPNYFTKEYLLDHIISLVNKNHHQKLARIRLVIYRGNGGLYDAENHFPNCLIQSWELNPANNVLNENGLITDVFTGAKKVGDDYSGIKSNNYLGYAMAALWVKQQKINDAFLLNAFERVADATIANVFIIKGDTIKTPLLQEGGINGIMRRVLIERLPTIGLKVEETLLSIDDLLDADELFLSNSIYGIRWVKQFRERHYNNEKSKFIHKKLIIPINSLD